jgi:intracellular sulfur oxidation DsrE/DsrF family protein
MALVAAALTGLALAPSGGAIAQSTVSQSAARQKVIFHVADGDPAKWVVALNNVFNVRKELGPGNVEIEVVAVNAGLGLLKLESPQSTRIAEAIKGGVKFVACENSMRGQNVTRDDMLPDIGYTPAGIVELMQRQREGYAYIRP